MASILQFSLLVILATTLVKSETTDNYAKDQKEFQYDYYDDIIFPSKMGKESIRGSSEGPVNLCYLVQPTPIICKCDENVIDITCYVMTTVAKNDLVWDLFGDKKTVVKLRINSRPEGSLTFVPSYAFEHLHNLQTLSFAHGRIVKVHSFAFARLPRLSSIDISNNGIEFLDETSFAHLHNLVDLALSENFLTHLRSKTFIDLPQLRILFLDRNNISKIDDGAFDELSELTELEIWGNSLNMLTPGMFKGLRKLHHLDLSYNRLEVIEEGTFKHAPRLVEINLQHNLIQEIQQNSFDGLTHLMRLRLSNNMLTTLPSHPPPFAHLTRLMLLDLRDNQMKTLPAPVIMSLANLYNTSAYFHVEGNPFHCDCKIYWMVTLLSSSYPTPLREELGAVKCNLPSSIKSVEEDTSGEDSDEEERRQEKFKRLLTHVPWDVMGCVVTTRSTPYKYEVPAAAAFSPTSASKVIKDSPVMSATPVPGLSPKQGTSDRKELNDDSMTGVTPPTISNSNNSSSCISAKLTVPFILECLLLLAVIRRALFA